MELLHDGSIIFIPDPDNYKQSPKYIDGYGMVDSVSSQHIPLQIINLENKILFKKEAVYNKKNPVVINAPPQGYGKGYLTKGHAADYLEETHYGVLNKY